MSSYKVLWTNFAISDLEEVLAYIEKDRPAAAKNIYQKIKKACAGLNKHPQRFQVIPQLLEIGVTFYREMAVPPYNVIYKLIGRVVTIIAVVDSRRDVEVFLIGRLLRLS